jgi:hypothetical protein
VAAKAAFYEISLQFLHEVVISIFGMQERFSAARVPSVVDKPIAKFLNCLLDILPH